MEKMPPITKKNSSDTKLFTRSASKSAEKKKSYRESKKPKMAIQTFYSPEKELKRGQIDSRFIPNKFIYSAPFIQNVDIERSQTTSSSRILDSINRSQGRILAYPGDSKEKTIPGFQVPRTGLAIQGNAFRVKHCTKDIHQSNDSGNKRIGKVRNLVSNLPGRSSHNCSNKTRMCTSSSIGTTNFEKTGSFSKRQKVKNNTSTNIRVAGNRLEPPRSHSSSFSRKIRYFSRKLEKPSTIAHLLEKRSDENTGTSQLDRSMRPNCETNFVNNKNNLKIVQKESYRFVNRNSQKFKDSAMQLDIQKKPSTTTGFSHTSIHYPNRCLSRRLGCSNKPEKLSWKVRQFNGIFNKHPRASCSMVRPTNNLSERQLNPNSVRQRDSCCSIKESRINKFLPVITGRIDLEEDSKVQLEHQSSSHQRKLQCTSRSTLKKHTVINRMVHQPSSIPRKNSQDEPRSTSGSICNSPQQEAREVYIPVSGRQSSSSRCSVDILGEMGSPISLSSNTPDFEGFVQVNEHTVQERYSDYSRITIETMVHGSPTPKSSINNPGSPTGTNSSGQSSNSSTNHKTSRLEVIKRVYQSNFPNCQRAIDLLAAPIRKSSINEYERKWFCFRKFLQRENIAMKDITMANAINFFDYLFFEKNLKPGTISHYRTALTIPLKLRCGIDLHDPAVSSLIKAMYIQRPNIPVAAPAWSLNKVLLGLDKLKDNISLELSLQKTAFLLLLATGWRISELHACVRDKDFCFISSENILRIRPHPTFIAKNEDLKKRWTHKIIKPLKLSDDSTSRLCPVKSLQDYLWKSPRVTKGSLFLHPSTQKQLTILQLSTYICKFILSTNPDVKVKVHDIRKYSASYSLIETMDISEVVSSIGWRSPYTFWKFYMAQTEPLSLNVVLPCVSNSTEVTTQKPQVIMPCVSNSSEVTTQNSQVIIPCVSNSSEVTTQN